MNRMFPFITGTENPLGGKCPGGCVYCWAQGEKGLAQRHKMAKYEGPPRLYPKVLKKRYGAGDFIFDCDMRDKYSPDVPDEMIFEVYRWQMMSPLARFLDLTKWPTRYPSLLSRVPKNVVIGATVETNRSMPLEVSRAPSPMARLEAMKYVAQNTDHRTFVSVEPIMDFDVAEFASLIRAVMPWKVAVGYDNYGNGLDEPLLLKTDTFIELLEEFTEVERKTIRKAWWEK